MVEEVTDHGRVETLDAELRGRLAFPVMDELNRRRKASR